MKKVLTQKQKAYYEERINFFSTLWAGGKKIAIPYGFIFDKAISMTDAECDEWLNKKEEIEINLN